MRYRSRLELDYKQTSIGKSAKPQYRIFVAGTFITLLLLGCLSAYTLFASVNIEPSTESALAQQPVTTEIISLALEEAAPSPTSKQIVAAPRQPVVTTRAENPASELTAQQLVTETALANPPDKHTRVIKPGDNLSTLFTALGLNAELHQILQLGEPVQQLKSIYPNQKIHFYLQDQALVRLELETSLNRHLVITQQDQTYSVSEVVRDFDLRTRSASSTINDSLFLAGQRAGLSDAIIMQLANIFGWDIDFALDIRAGDQFAIIFQEKYLDGAKVKDGEILVAEFINAGRSYRAVRYTDSQNKTDYYSDHGHSMRKPFLRTPVDFTRISSKFDPQRLHPILNTIRAHKGVDYAAPTGTPIKAAGDGKVIFRGSKSGYGRTVIIQHGAQYSTLYAHLHRYAKQAQQGARVKQGQVIGYVGQSGMATGPHLHYEFRVNGVHRNPLTVKLPDAQPLPATEMTRFKYRTATQFAKLDELSHSLLASNDSQPEKSSD